MATLREYVDRSQYLETLAIGVPALVMDMETGEILFATRPLEEMFGYRMCGELIGKTIEALIPERLAEKHKAHRSAYASNPEPRLMGSQLTLYGRQRDGTEFPVEVTLTPVAMQPQQRRVVVAAVANLTARKE
jgi:two-component system, LuxR family, sensor kinase FixL